MLGRLATLTAWLCLIGGCALVGAAPSLGLLYAAANTPSASGWRSVAELNAPFHGSNAP